MAIDPATLKTRFPAFSNVPDATIQYWLDDAGAIATEAWGVDQEPGTLELAAHNMTVTPGVLSSGSSSIPAGVTRFRSGSTDISFSDAAAAQAADGGYKSTPYGRMFLPRLRRNVGGPYLVGCVDVC